MLPKYWYSGPICLIEVGCFLSLLHRCSAPTVRSVCYAESRPARVVLVNICRLFCSSCSICHWHVSLSLEFHGVFHILLSMQFFSVCRLQVVFMACVAFKVFAWCLPPSSQHISCIRRFQTCFYNVHCPHFFQFFVAFLRFFNLYSAYLFQGSLMVISAPNLVFVACIAFSLVSRHLLLLYKVYSVLLCSPFLVRFLWYVASLVVCAARHFGLVFHLHLSFILCRPCFFCKHGLSNIHSLLLFNSYLLLVIFSFLQLVTVQEIFVFIFVICSSMFQKQNILVFFLVYWNSGAIFILFKQESPKFRIVL